LIPEREKDLKLPHNAKHEFMVAIRLDKNPTGQIPWIPVLWGKGLIYRTETERFCPISTDLESLYESEIMMYLAYLLGYSPTDVI
jgi:hypothetical protein